MTAFLWFKLGKLELKSKRQSLIFNKRLQATSLKVTVTVYRVDAMNSSLVRLFVLLDYGEEEVQQSTILEQLETFKPDLDLPLKTTRKCRGMLHIACGAGEMKLVKYLLDNKASPNVKDIQGFPPLYTAVRMGGTEMVTALVEAKADVNALSPKNESPYELAIRQQKSELVSILEPFKAERAPPDASKISHYERLGIAAEGKMIPVFNKLEHSDPKGVKALEPKICKILSRCGIMIKGGHFDVNAPNTERPYILVSAKVCAAEVTKILLDMKANPNTAGKDGMTPLHYAFQHCDNVESDAGEATVKCLLKAKADGSLRTYNNGKTPIELITKEKTRKWLQELLDGKDTHRPGYTPGATLSNPAVSPMGEAKTALTPTNYLVHSPAVDNLDGSHFEFKDEAAAKEAKALAGRIARSDFDSVLRDISVVDTRNYNRRPKLLQAKRQLGSSLTLSLRSLYGDEAFLSETEISEYFLMVRNTQATKQEVRKAIQHVQGLKFNRKDPQVAEHEFLPTIQTLEVICNRKKKMRWEAKLLDMYGDGWVSKYTAQSFWMGFKNRDRPDFNDFLKNRREIDIKMCKLGDYHLINPLRGSNVHVNELIPLAYCGPNPERHI
ncbi:hypothetical protein AAMO2058_000215200 [Amorphochlora amoebiformis]